jgi:hypothetical protein
VIPLIPSLANIAGNRKSTVSHVYWLASLYGSSKGSLYVCVDLIIPSDSKKMKTKIYKLVDTINLSS